MDMRWNKAIGGITVRRGHMDAVAKTERENIDEIDKTRTGSAHTKSMDYVGVQGRATPSGPWAGCQAWTCRSTETGRVSTVAAANRRPETRRKTRDEDSTVKTAA